MNLTLVAHYGTKSDFLRKFITDTQRVLSRALPVAFEAYKVEQVHGTIIGLEGTRLGEHIINNNYLEQRRLLKAIDLKKLLELIDGSRFLPFTVQIGGYKHQDEYPFTSRGQHPYVRSFSIQRDNRGEVAVAMGWPRRKYRYLLTLDNLRRSASSANVLHKYHSSPTDIDNDFFFVLGRLNRGSLSELAIQVAQEKMRSHFEQREVSVTIERENLSVVAYNDATLPWKKCRVFSLADARGSVRQLNAMYHGPCHPAV